MSSDDDLGGVARFRLDELQKDVEKLQADQISRDWLDEKFRTLNEKIDGVITTDKARRNAVYAALVTGVVSLVSALVIVALTLPQGATP